MVGRKYNKEQVKDMLLIKGDKGKSSFINNVLGNNLYFVYCDYPINIDGYWVSSLNHSIDEFKDFIKAYVHEEDKTCKENLYDYLIIYTNESEENLKDFISWLKDNERWFLCRNTLIACK